MFHFLSTYVATLMADPLTHLYLAALRASKLEKEPPGQRMPSPSGNPARASI